MPMVGTSRNNIASAVIFDEEYLEKETIIIYRFAKTGLIQRFCNMEQVAVFHDDNLLSLDPNAGCLLN